MRATFVLALALAAAVLGLALGCGGSDTLKPAATTSASAQVDVADLIVASEGVPEDPIGKVVYEFLDAMRKGDSAGVSQRLTPLALKRAQETDSPILPPGSPTARFKVGNVEVIDKEKAVVDSVWTDLDVDGKPSNEPILWALKLCDGEWRVSGMAADMGAGADPMVIDFENPESMAPQKPINRENVAGSPTTPSGEQPASAVARNPFDQGSQR